MTLLKNTAAIALALSLSVGASHAMDTGQYRSIVGDVVRSIDAGEVDTAALKKKMDQLIAIGISGVRGYAITTPEAAKLMNFVAESASAMKAMSMDEIEAAWHDGEALAQIGVDFDELDHFGAVISHMDAVVHPATAYLAIAEYERTGDEDYLDQVKDELGEVVEHLSYIE